MGMSQSEIRGAPNGLVAVLVRLLGAGAAAPLVEIGPNGKPLTASATSGESGVTTTRAAAGDYTLTFRDLPGQFVAISEGLQGVDTPAATTPRSVQYERDAAFAAGAKTIRIFHATPSTDAAAAAASDIPATEEVNLIFWFMRQGVVPRHA